MFIPLARPFFQATALLALAVVAPATAYAQAWPAKPIRMIVPFPVSGGSDSTARILSQRLTEHLRQQIVIDNRVGAAGVIGTEVAARAAPDGYTLLLGSASEITMLPAISSKLPFDPLKDFVPIARVADVPLLLLVHPALPARTPRELIELARKRPGDINFGSTGVGSMTHLAMLMFEKIAGVKMNHVPYKGASDVRAATLGRQIDVAAVNIGESLQAIKGGSPFRNLGQMSPARTDLAPDLATFKEQGYNIELSSLRGIAAPRGLPADVRERLVGAVRRAAADPEFVKVAAGFFAPLRYLAPEQYGTVMREAEGQFRKLWGEMPWGEK